LLAKTSLPGLWLDKIVASQNWLDKAITSHQFSKAKLASQGYV